MRCTRIVIFAKAPVAGLAKTRLAPALGADGAARLALRMLDHSLQTAMRARLGPVELCVTPDVHDPCWQRLTTPCAVAWTNQGSGDLGARMARAARRSIGQGENVLLIGTDCPALECENLRAAALALLTHDAALIPSTDGGYVLLGLARFDTSLFHQISWGTAAVCTQTRERLGQLSWRTQYFDAMHDIDVPPDLAYLPACWRQALGFGADSVPERG